MREVQGRLFDYRPFGPRDPDEEHRSATPLELFFDLIIVVAVAAAAAGLHHGISEGHAAPAVGVFLIAFFAIWWAWMNYTWFASAYDNDGPIFRLLTLWIMGGALLLAASVSRFFDGLDITLPVIAYVVMRIGMIALWVIAARVDSDHSATARRYAVGIALVQVFWIFLALGAPREAPLFPALVVAGLAAEMAVPVWAERASLTPWNREHIVERYGLLMIITLGEILVAGALSLAEGGERLTLASPLLHVAIAALIIAGSMWWLYFSRDDHLRVHAEGRGLHFVWGYGHAIAFGAAAAVGAGFAVLVDILAGRSDISLRMGDIAVGVPLALYMIGLWFVRDRFVISGAARHILLLFAALVLAAAFIMPASLETMALLAALAVFVRSALATRERRARRAAATLY